MGNTCKQAAAETTEEVDWRELFLNLMDNSHIRMY
jgi:hypothetical protein